MLTLLPVITHMVTGETPLRSPFFDFVNQCTPRADDSCCGIIEITKSAPEPDPAPPSLGS
jgi:hypothetical protein